MKERNLTVREGHSDHTRKDGYYSLLPFLLLKGNWLKEAGFTIDRKVKVVVEEDRLTILPKDD